MKIPTLINSSSKINGELIFTTDVRIDGEVFGKVESDKNVIIGAEGFVKGFLRAKDLVVFGRIEGNIIVSGITILHEHASVFGNLYTKVFEVKDGATITARVITYEKLEAIDEAQICLAEEMIKIEPNRRQIPAYNHTQITFEDPIDFVKEEQLDSFSLNKTLWEQMPGNSGDMLSKLIGQNTGNENFIHHQEDPSGNDKISKLLTPSDSLSEIVDLSDNLSLEGDAVQLTDETIENRFSLIAGESISSVNSVDTNPSDLPSESEEMLFLEQTGIEEDEIFTLLAISDELIENQQDELVAAQISEQTLKSDDEFMQLLDFDFEDNIVENGELVLFPLPSPISIAECLGEPIKEDSSKIRKGKKKPYSSDATLISPTARKSKNYSISGFEELRNLLSPVRYQDTKSVEKKSEQEKFGAKKNSENEPANKAKAIENSDFFLNEAIRKLPSDDYSSLFN